MSFEEYRSNEPQLIKLAALRDEVTKIAGRARMGRIPIKPSTLANRPMNHVKNSVTGVSGVVKEAGLVARIAENHPKKFIGGSILAGAGAYHTARQANEDRKVGKMIRKQQVQQ